MHRRVFPASVRHPCLRVDRVDHRPPGVDILAIAGDEQRVAEPDERARDAIAILALPGHRVHRAEAPAVGVAPPAPVGAADAAVEIDEARDDAAVRLHPRQPCVHVVDDPASILRLAGHEVGVGRQRRRDEIEEVVADDVGVFLVVLEELLIRVLAVQRDEAGRVERIADPVERRGLAQQRAAAAVDHRADQLLLGIVVRGIRVLTHVETGEPAGALAVGRQRGHRQRHAVEQLQALAVVHPVRLRRELLHVHAVASGRDVGGLRLGVLAEHAFEPGEVAPEDLVVSPQRVQLRPAVEVLERIVGPVVGAPAQDALHVAAGVVVLLVELAAGRHVLGEEAAFQRRPRGRRHGRVDS